MVGAVDRVFLDQIDSVFNKVSGMLMYIITRNM
jgi:hypothetical protein